jgi:TatD DNase family protein
MIEWIDTHTHLEMLENSPDEVLRAAEEQGVKQMITIGTHPDENKKVIEIAKKYFPKVACTLGIHPHEAQHYSHDVERDIEAELSQPYVVGVGEIGLDYHYDHSPRGQQQDVFRKQLDLAARHRLPVQIHTREAEEDTVKILREFKGLVTGLFHCFTSSAWLAREGLDLGFNISFSGIITFKTAEDLRDIVKIVPLDRIHVETDAPFLTPVPFRGKKNAPALIVHTAKKIAELKGVSEEELSGHILDNARKLFPKLIAKG